MSCSCGIDHFSCGTDRFIEPEIKDWKFCKNCGTELIRQKSSSPFEFNPMTGDGVYFVVVKCPKYSYPHHTGHTNGGYNEEKVTVW